MACISCREKGNEWKHMLTVQHTIAPSICSTQLPFVKGTPMQSSTFTAPTIFRLPNYDKKLKECTCSDVYHQYTLEAIQESISLAKPLTPMFRIAQMKTSIQFFTPSVSTFSISQQDYQHKMDSKLPLYFSWMDNEEITRPQSQGMCGSSWAIAVSTCLNDVFVVEKKISNPKLSPSYLLSCMPQQQCNGGDIVLAVKDIESKGIKPTSCINDSWNAILLPPDELNKLIPECHCTDSAPFYYPSEIKAICIPPKLQDLSGQEAEILQSHLSHLYGSINHIDLSSVPFEHVQTLIKHHIYTHGPVVSGFHVFKNFLKGNFMETNDIYVETSPYQGVAGVNYNALEEDWVGSHAIVIVGWGTDTVHDHPVEYWLVRNSWGTSWGVGGLCKIAMYGTKPYHNRVSQFEYPSIVTTDSGYGVTGGVLLLKAGEMKKPMLSTSLLSTPIVSTQIRPFTIHATIFGTTYYINMIVLLALLLLLLYFCFFHKQLIIYCIISIVIVVLLYLLLHIKIMMVSL